MRQAPCDTPLPDVSFKGGVRRFPNRMPRPKNGLISASAAEGRWTSLAARRWLSTAWVAESVMAIGMQDVVIAPERMERLRHVIRGCREPYRVAEAGDYVQECSEPVAREGLRRRGLLQSA